MKKIVEKSLLLLASIVFICCILYPLTLWLVGQTLLPYQANGSLIYDAQGNLLGSKLIAQPFESDLYFHPRPSAASYDAAASSSSNLAPSNPALRERVAKAIGSQQNVPADMVTTSASGLDPHITLQNARYQLARVSQAWSTKLNQDPAKTQNEIETILQNNKQAPLMAWQVSLSLMFSKSILVC